MSEPVGIDTWLRPGSHGKVLPAIQWIHFRLAGRFRVIFLEETSPAEMWLVDYWRGSESVPGFVLLSGKEDSYVDAEKTRGVFKQNSTHFKLKQYPGTLHEIDNELEPIAGQAREDILNFILSASK